MKRSQLPLIQWTNALLFLLMIGFTNLSAQSSTPIFDHNHDDHSCKGICFVTPDSTVQMKVYLPFDSVQTTQSVGVKDGVVYFQGDIILGDYNELTDPNKGLGINGFRWTNSTVRYYISGNFANWQRNQIVQAANDVAAKTDICFEQLSSPSGNYVNVVQGGGCSSFVGMRGGAQALTLAANCGLAATIHEFLHAAGMWHEQSRSDRGSHIIINYGNVISGMEHNFNIQYGSTLFGGYDVNSIMHYNSYAFSKNGQPTIVKINGGTIPYINNMSSGDIATINAMYNTCGGGGGGGGGCSAPTATENYTSSITQNTARLYCSANYVYRQWRYRHNSTSSWTTLNYTTNIAYVNISGLAAANTYIWQSRVWCGTVWSSWSVNESFTTQAGGNTCTAPTASQNTTTGITASSASLNCSANYTYKQYRYRASSSGSWTTTNYTTNQNSRTITGLSAATAYYWQSRVWCGNVWGAWSSDETFTTSGGGGGGGGSCGTPTGLYAHNVSATQLSLSWTAASGANSYIAYYWNGTQWLSFATVYQASMNVTVSPGSSFCFLIGSFCNGSLGGYSNYVCVTTPNSISSGAPIPGNGTLGFGLPYEPGPFVNLDVTDAMLIKEEAGPIPAEETMLDIQLAPNPSRQNQPISLTINASTSDVQIMVTNINGSVVLQREYTLEPGNNQIELEEMPAAGMYFVTVQNNEQVATKKLMILD